MSSQYLFAEGKGCSAPHIGVLMSRQAGRFACGYFCEVHSILCEGEPPEGVCWNSRQIRPSSRNTKQARVAKLESRIQVKAEVRL